MLLIEILSCISNMDNNMNNIDKPTPILQIIENADFEQGLRRKIENKDYDSAIKYIKDRERGFLVEIVELSNLLNGILPEQYTSESISIYKAINTRLKEEIRGRITFEVANSVLISALYSNDIGFAKSIINYIELEKKINKKGLESVASLSGKNILHLLADMDFELISELLSELSQYLPILMEQNSNNEDFLNPFNYSLKIRNTDMANYLFENGAKTSLSLISTGNGISVASSLDLLMFGRYFKNGSSVKKLTVINDDLLLQKIDEDINDKEYELADKIIYTSIVSSLERLNYRTLNSNSTPLISAAIMGSLKLITLLINIEANIFEKDNRGLTFFHFMMCNVNFNDNDIIYILRVLEDKDARFINKNNLLSYLIKLKNNVSIFKRDRLKLLKVLLEKANLILLLSILTRDFSELKTLFNSAEGSELFNNLLDKVKLCEINNMISFPIKNFISIELNKNKKFLDLAIENNNLRGVEILLENGLIPKKESLESLFKKFYWIGNKDIREDSVELKIVNLISANKKIYEEENLHVLSFLFINSWLLPERFMKDIFNNIKYPSKLDFFISNYSFIKRKERNFYFLINEIKKTEDIGQFTSSFQRALINNIRYFKILKEDDEVLQGFIESIIEIYGIQFLFNNLYNNKLDILENLLDILKRYNFLETLENILLKYQINFPNTQEVILKCGSKKVRIYSLDAYGDNLLQKAVKNSQYNKAIKIVKSHFSRYQEEKIIEINKYSIYNKFYNHYISIGKTEEEAKAVLLGYIEEVNTELSFKKKLEILKKYFLEFVNIEFLRLLGKLNNFDDTIILMLKMPNIIELFFGLRELKKEICVEEIKEENIGHLSKKVYDFLSSYGNKIPFVIDIHLLLEDILKFLNDEKHLKDPMLLFAYKNNGLSALDILVSRGREDIIIEFRKAASIKARKIKDNFENLLVCNRKVKEIIEEDKGELKRKKAKKN